jgi:hypothetical protein
MSAGTWARLGRPSVGIGQKVASAVERQLLRAISSVVRRVLDAKCSSATRVDGYAPHLFDSAQGSLKSSEASATSGHSPRKPVISPKVMCPLARGDQRTNGAPRYSSGYRLDEHEASFGR